MVLFLSDNGAEGAYTGELFVQPPLASSDYPVQEAKPFLHGSTLNELIDKYYNNKHINLGNHDSFIWYGPRWAQVGLLSSSLPSLILLSLGGHCSFEIVQDALYRRRYPRTHGRSIPQTVRQTRSSGQILRHSHGHYAYFPRTGGCQTPCGGYERPRTGCLER